MSSNTGTTRKKRRPVARPSGDGSSPIARAECYLARHRRAAVVGLIVLSALLRVGYFVELNGGACVWQHRWSESDMSYFDSWAARIAGGDWLSEGVDPPVHDWHGRIAEDYYRRNPDELREAETLAARDESNPDPAQALWNRWLGEKRFYQDPMYPYLLGLTRMLSPDVRWVFAWQMAIGILTNVLIYVLGRRFFGDLVGLLSGLLASLYSPLLHHELILLRETLIVFAAMGMVYVIDTAARRDKLRWWVAAGLTMGAGILLKAHFALFAAGAMVLTGWRYRRSAKALSRAVGAIAGGVVLALSPLVARNLIVGAPPLSTGSGGGVTFVVHNAFDSSAGPGRVRLSAGARIMEHSGGWGSTVGATLRTHPGPASYLRLLWSKFEGAWNWYESPDNANLYYYRLHSTVLRYMPVTFLLLAPVGMVGLVLGLARLREVRYLYLQVFVNLAVLVAFAPLGRFRLPMAAGLIPFAALTAVRIVEWVFARRGGRAAAALGAVVLLSLWTGRPLPDDRPLIRPPDYTVPYQTYYSPRIERAMQAEEWGRASDIVAEMLRYEPDSVRRLGPWRVARTSSDRKLAAFYGRIHTFYAKVLQRAGRAEAAAAERRRGRELAGAVDPPASEQR